MIEADSANPIATILSENKRDDGENIRKIKIFFHRLHQVLLTRRSGLVLI